LRLVYFTGEPQGGDIYNIRREAGKTEFTSPLRINSEPGSALAVGTIRGAHLAVGKTGAFTSHGVAGETLAVTTPRCFMREEIVKRLDPTTRLS
jgi:hypothetical protein